MSRETMLHLNTQTLIGMTDLRGNAWTYRRELQGAESNHYPMAVPVEHVKRRLFHWTPVSRRMAMEVPATFETMTHLDPQGLPARWVHQTDIQGIARDDDQARLGIFKTGYKIHVYDEWLLKNVEAIIGQGLSISSAGLLKGGAIAWVEISVAENMIVNGVEFRPNLLATTTCDGSLSTTYKLTTQMTVCDNTREIALGENSPQMKIKHSAGSLDKITDVREALGLIDATGATAAAQFKAETETAVSSVQFKEVVKLLVPVKEGAGVRATNNAGRKIDELFALWNNDPRVAPWKGTAFGVAQAFNTWSHHVQGGLPAGSDDAQAVARGERNMLRAVNGGTLNDDANVARVLAKVLANA